MDDKNVFPRAERRSDGSVVIRISDNLQVGKRGRTWIVVSGSEEKDFITPSREEEVMWNWLLDAFPLIESRKGWTD